MYNMQVNSYRIWGIVIGYLIAQAKPYPVQGWNMNMYPQAPREYSDDEYYYTPKVHYYYDAPALPVPEGYGQPPYPYYYDTYGHFAHEAPQKQEERLAALPIGQETWFENEAAPHWRSNDVDDVNAAFLDNLILTQMAQDAQRRRENARAAFQPVDYEEKEKDNEDEDVRELKALAGKPFYHVPKTVPRIEDDDEDDYPNDDGFINWNGNKRSLNTAALVTTQKPISGQKEVAMLRPAQHAQHNKQSAPLYNTIKQLLENKAATKHEQGSTKSRRIDKRFVAGDTDLVLELRGLKHRIPT